MELEIGTQMLLLAFGLAIVLGAVTNHTNFCTMGAVSDWVNIGDTGRFRAWLLAIAVTMGGVLVLEFLEVINFDDARIPYRHPNFAWPRYILGGLMFGVGMTLASGCGSKNLVRLGQGNLKSLLVLIIMGLFAYLMTRTDFYGIVFASWMAPLALDLAARGIDSQEMPRIIATTLGGDAVDKSLPMIRLVMGGLIVFVLLAVTLGSRMFRENFDHMLAGIVIGMLVLGGWYATGGPLGIEWVEWAEFADDPPAFYGLQSFTFVNPAADALALAREGGNPLFITFGLAAFIGMIVGSFAYAIVTHGFRIEWFASLADFFRHLFGAALMGVGGVLGLGCTVGQGITGLSTLAMGSLVTLVFIVLGSALTMKVQYYKMLYEDASVVAAFTTALVDLRLLPSSMRKLEAL